jgi:hypothetical protein
MPDTGTATASGPTGQKTPATRQARRLSGLRTNSAAICVMLLAEYGLGMGVNLYVHVPPAGRGGIAAALGRALTSQPAALAVHAGLGLLMLVAGVSVLIRAITARHWLAIVASATGLLAIAGAAGSGASFVSDGQTGASMAMAVLASVALLCYLGNLVVVGSPAVIKTEGRK